MKIALYIRVSTVTQYEKGQSVPEQKKRLKAYCDSKGWTDYEFFIDPGNSGSNMDRPALQKMISQIKRFDLVLVYKLDRLSRNQRDTLYLIEDVFNANGVEFNSITENFDTSTPAGKLMLSMMSAFAELERQQINERMTMGRLAAANLGKWRGGSGVPTGYIYSPKSKGGSGRLEIDEEKAEYVKMMYALALKGYSFTHIRDVMAKEGLYTATAHVVKTILSNPIYIGYQRYGGEIFPSNHTPIIDRETFDKVQEIVKDRTKPSMKRKHLLTGFLYCSCGSRACYHKNIQHGKSYEYYQCYSRMCHKTMGKAKKCSNKVWRKADLEETIWDILEELEYEDVISEAPDLITPKKKEIEKVEKKIDKLMDLYLVDGIPQDSLVTRLNALNREKDTLAEQLATIEKKSHKTGKKEFRQIKSKLSDIKESDIETQRAFLGSLIESITLLPQHDLEIKWKF